MGLAVFITAQYCVPAVIVGDELVTTQSGVPPLNGGALKVAGWPSAVPGTPLLSVYSWIVPLVLPPFGVQVPPEKHCTQKLIRLAVPVVVGENFFATQKLLANDSPLVPDGTVGGPVMFENSVVALAAAGAVQLTAAAATTTPMATPVRNHLMGCDRHEQHLSEPEDARPTS
ncbi:MAG: hypothetical protein JO286_17360 [Solirubrobacterales bacterium]|nr:hypothetical protein [Solirubrobacterales bacterium]